MPPPIPVALSEVALRYHADGWHPLPLPPRAKALPPTGHTGYGGSDLTADEIVGIDWSGNIGLRMPADVLGLDVDVYKGGGDTLAGLIAKCGPLPPTWISHSLRNDGSGIRFYRVPILAWVTGLPGIEIIQRVHRYAVVFPSIHPDGRPYGWVDQIEQEVNGGLPVVDDLPELPWPWIRELSRAQQSDLGAHSRAVNGDALDEFLDGHNRADLPGSIGPALAEFTQKWHAGYSRHDAMQHCLIWAMEYVGAELAAGRPTVTLFGDLWVEAVSPDARRAELWSGRRTTEFQGMLRHAVGKVLAKPEADMHKLHDEHALPIAPGAMDAERTKVPPAAPDVAEAALTEQRIPVIAFRELPDPFTIPPITWHAEGLLCRETHGELAGAEKSFKSYLGLALDVGLAAGVAVLGHFPVAERQRVLVLVGEGGEGPFLRRLGEICTGYGFKPDRLRGWLRYTTEHASASSLRFLDGIRRELETFGPTLVHADPWYTYQPSLTESSQLTSVGAALEVVGDTCRAGGATALINHHFNRSVNGGLRQITGAGHAEWVDSWLLTRHREPPNLTAGIYRLRLDVGSRQWGGGSYDVDLRSTPPFGGLRWEVRPAVDEADGADLLDRYKVDLLKSGRKRGEPQVRTAWIERTPGDDKKLRLAFDELIGDGRITAGPTAGTWLPVALSGSDGNGSGDPE